MIPVLAATFGAGALAALALARADGRASLWIAAFLETLLAFHEFSFALRGVAEWIRIDLLLTLPLFVAGNLLLTWISLRQAPGWWAYVFPAAAVFGPIWLFLGR